MQIGLFSFFFGLFDSLTSFPASHFRLWDAEANGVLHLIAVDASGAVLVWVWGAELLAWNPVPLAAFNVADGRPALLGDARLVAACVSPAEGYMVWWERTPDGDDDGGAFVDVVYARNFKLPSVPAASSATPSSRRKGKRGGSQVQASAAVTLTPICAVGPDEGDVVRNVLLGRAGAFIWSERAVRLSPFDTRGLIHTLYFAPSATGGTKAGEPVEAIEVENADSVDPDVAVAPAASAAIHTSTGELVVVDEAGTLLLVKVRPDGLQARRLADLVAPAGDPKTATGRGGNGDGGSSSGGLWIVPEVRSMFAHQLNVGILTDRLCFVHNLATGVHVDTIELPLGLEADGSQPDKAPRANRVWSAETTSRSGAGAASPPDPRAAVPLVGLWNQAGLWQLRSHKVTDEASFLAASDAPRAGIVAAAMCSLWGRPRWAAKLALDVLAGGQENNVRASCAFLFVFRGC